MFLTSSCTNTSTPCSSPQCITGFKCGDLTALSTGPFECKTVKTTFTIFSPLYLCLRLIKSHLENLRKCKFSYCHLTSLGAETGLILLSFYDQICHQHYGGCYFGKMILLSPEKTKETAPSFIQTLYFKAPLNLLAASPPAQQRGHRVVLKKDNLYVSRFIILAFSRGCPRSLDNTDHRREQIQNIVGQRNFGTFSS